MRLFKLLLLVLIFYSAIIFAEGENQCKAFPLGNDESSCLSYCRNADCDKGYCDTFCLNAAVTSQPPNQINQSRVFVPPPGLQFPSAGAR